MVRYVDYSDDGLRFYSGVERAVSSLTMGTEYEADVQLTGEEHGEMRVKACWSGVQDGARLRFDLGDDGKPRSRGYVRYGENLLSIDELVE